MGAGVAGALFSFFADAAFVDGAIAVVIHTVTGFFFGGEDFAFAGSPVSVLTLLGSWTAYSLTVKTAVFRFFAAAFLADTGFGFDMLIDKAVTVVVFLIAFFLGRCELAFA